MKALVIFSIFFFVAPSMFAEDNTLQKFPAKDNVTYKNADYSINVEDNDLVLTPSHRCCGSIRITPKYEVYLDNKCLDLNGDQKKIVGKYYDLTFELADRAKEVGYEGAKIGVQGAALGVKAVGSVLKLVLPNYDSEDLERDMERESAKIEAKAVDLESEAHELEKIADELKEVQDKMKDSIPEMGQLKWF